MLLFVVSCVLVVAVLDLVLFLLFMVLVLIVVIIVIDIAVMGQDFIGPIPPTRKGCKDRSRRFASWRVVHSVAAVPLS